MKTYIRNVAVLDMTHATEESIAQVEKVENVALVLISHETRHLLSRLTIENVASVKEVDAGAVPLEVNGSHTLSELPADRNTFLMVNGTLTVSADTKPEALSHGLSGGVINGTLCASESQMRAISGAGVSVNGSTYVYPDGAAPRPGAAALTAAEAAALQNPPFLMKQVMVEAGALQALAERGMPLYGVRGAYIYEKDAPTFFRVWKGSGNIVQVPDGFAMMQGSQTLGVHNALMLRGKRYINGDLLLREDVTETSLAGLDALCVSGRLLTPVALIGRLLAILRNEPELVPYEGKLINVDGKYNVTSAAMLGEGKVAINIDGRIAFDPSIDPEALRARITMLYVDGNLHATDAQHAALLPVLLGEYHLTTSGDHDQDDSRPAGEFHLVDNAVMYVL